MEVQWLRPIITYVSLVGGCGGGPWDFLPFYETCNASKNILHPGQVATEQVHPMELPESSFKS